MGDFLSEEVAGPVATIAIEPVARQLGSNNRATTGTSTVITAASDKDTYITGVQVSITADASSDSTTFLVQIVQNGATVRLAQYFKTTLTAYTCVDYINFSKPIKLDRGSIVTIQNTFTVGTSNIGCVLHGYTEEVTSS